MAIINIRCPGCRRGYKLTTENPVTLRMKMFRCPKCGFAAPFSMLLGTGQPNNPSLKTHIGGQPNNPSLKTHIGGQPNNPLETHIGGLDRTLHVTSMPTSGGGSSKTRVSPGNKGGGGRSLSVLSTGASFPLMPGIYILGRDSSDSRATLRLAADPYMSRQHARLTVSVASGKAVCQICSLSTTNTLFVNGKEVPKGKTLTLRHGDKILMGMTEIVFSEK